MDKNLLPLDKTLKNRLARTVRDARDIAEAAAQAALEQLGVRKTTSCSRLDESDLDLQRYMDEYAGRHNIRPLPSSNR